jgi:penicillin amidase
MRRHALACARLLIGGLWRRLSGGAWGVGSPAGECRLSGLAQDVWIRRDEAGVAHVFAESAPDLGFGVGVAMAQDRRWQMETMRRLAYGRLAEVAGDRPLNGVSLHLVGPSLLAVDQFYRSLRIEGVCREELCLVSDDGRRVLEGFARGVNAWVEERGPADLAPEFLLAGVDPEPWRPEDCLAIGRLIGWLLSLAFVAKPILAALSADPLLARLLPPQMADGQCIGGTCPSGDAAGLDLLARHALGLLGPGTGSNNWVLGGSRTASGKPLLCNDPHLLLGLPALWYPIALTTPGHRVIGVTMAGIPAILIGRNERVAWGMTAVMADDGEFYRETLDDAGGRYRRDGEWRTVDAFEETFRVRGRSDPVRRTLRYVRHEGVLCPLLPGRDGEPPTSFRWAGLEAWHGWDGLLEMNRAASVREFEAALQAFAVPAQNVVVADTAGDIGYFCAGKFPRRPWADAAPCVLDGSRPEHAWGGYLAWAEHPHAADPADGYIVTANNRVATTLPSGLARGFWEPPYRATRISSLLSRLRDATRSDMAGIQADVCSVQAAGLVARLVRPTRERLSDPRARRAADLLLAWDFRMEADSAAAALYHLFYQELLRQCVRPVLDRRVPGLFARYLSTLHLAVAAVDTAFLTEDPLVFPEGAPAAVEACLAAAWDAASARWGGEPTTWRWGDLHRLTFHHMLGRGTPWAVRLLAWALQLNRGPIPRPGDGMTVNLGAFLLTAPFGIAVGPSYRQIVDLGAPEESRWIVAGGVSGDFRSPHYADQVPLWTTGATLPMRFLPRDAPDGRLLKLVPGDRPPRAAAVCAVPARVL